MERSVADDTPQRRGGVARARALSPEARKEIATRAAQARWGHPEEDRLPKAIASGILRVGNALIPCAVLDDEENTRVLTQDGFLASIGRSKRPNTSDKAMLEGMPSFLRATGLKPFIDRNLTCSSTPIAFRPLRAGGHRGVALERVMDSVGGFYLARVLSIDRVLTELLSHPA